MSNQNIIEKIINSDLLKSKDCSRLFHGRGKLFPGLEHVAIDYYSPTLFIILYKECRLEFIEHLIKSLNEIPKLQVENILLQKRYLFPIELSAIKGNIPTNAIALEAGLKFNLQFENKQNVGFFLDMSPGRKLLSQISANKKVLNLFSYTCSLSIAALSGGADSVINIDMSKAALAVGEKNHHLNQLDIKKVRFLPYDIMKSWNNISKNGPYDIVVIDPPTNQGASFKVERDYYKIIKHLNAMTNQNAIILAALNSPFHTSQFLIDLFLKHAPEFIFQEIIYSAFSDMEKNPEQGLKIVLFKKT